MSLVERLKEARELRQLSQAQLETLSGVSQQVISRLETGKSESTREIVKLATALRVDPLWLDIGATEADGPKATPQDDLFLGPLKQNEMEYLIDSLKVFRKHSGKL